MTKGANSGTLGPARKQTLTMLWSFWLLTIHTNIGPRGCYAA